jgi:hypothetical protein
VDAGVNPLFPPEHQSPEAAKEDLLHIVRRDPRQLDQAGARWKLATIRGACDWLKGLTLSGVWQVLDRLKIGYELGRDHIHSPDPHYWEKLREVQDCLQQAAAPHGRVVVVFSDQLTFYPQPTRAKAWEATGGADQPLAQRSLRSNTTARV